jgi:dTDP-4-amino-4,6-dideoxygalactose transaminase
VIPILDLKQQYRELKRDIDLAVGAVFENGAFINGPNVRTLEEELARYLGSAEAVGVNSGTDALHLALRALGIGPGDEVVTTPFTFVATSEAIAMVGATPVFVDIDSRTYNIDPQAIEAAIGPRTAAIIPVHLYGLPADMIRICQIARRYQLAVVEDCAQAIGASVEGKRVGSFGDLGAFSFFPSKNLGAYGDGGMILTDNADLANRCRSLRAHGGKVKYHHDEIGVNSRLDEVQAAILRVKLPHLERWNELRRAHASAYREALAETMLVLPTEPQGMRHVFHQYTVRVNDRDAVQSQLSAYGVQTMVYYPVPLHLQKVHAAMGLQPGAYPESERASREVLSLPMYPELAPTSIECVVQAMKQAISVVA